MRMNFINRICLLLVYCITLSYADNFLNDPRLLYKLPSNSSVLDQKITVQRKFTNINQLTERLNKQDGLKVKVNNKSSDSPIPVTVCIDNGTIQDLLNQASFKLGYNWLIDGNILTFNAIHPLKELPKSKTKIVLSSLDVSKSESVNYERVWILNPKEKTLRNALTKWSNEAGWQLIWNVNADYPIVTTWNIYGSFESAVNQVLSASKQTDMPILARMYDSNKVLEIFTPINR